MSGNTSGAKSLIDRYISGRTTKGQEKDENPLWEDIYFLSASINNEFQRNGEYRKLMEFLYGKLEKWHLRTSACWFPTSISLQLGRAAALLGKFKKAHNHFQKAIRECTEMPFRPDLALAKFQLAELQFEHFPNEQIEALGHLDFAISEFKEMKMKPSLKKALELKSKNR